MGRWLWVGPGAKGLTAGLRARDLVVRRVVDDDLFDGLVDVSLLPLVAANARMQVLADLSRAGDVARGGEDLAVGDVARHVLLEHGAQPIPRALACSGSGAAIE